jgi:hypothetical protein
MSSHVLSITGFLPASPPGSRPGGALDRIACRTVAPRRREVRGSLIFIIKLANPHPTLSQAHSLALTGAGASVSPSGREKGEANLAGII